MQVQSSRLFAYMRVHQPCNVTALLLFVIHSAMPSFETTELVPSCDPLSWAKVSMILRKLPLPPDIISLILASARSLLDAPYRLIYAPHKSDATGHRLSMGYFSAVCYMWGLWGRPRTEGKLWAVAVAVDISVLDLATDAGIRKAERDRHRASYQEAVPGELFQCTVYETSEDSDSDDYPSPSLQHERDETLEAEIAVQIVCTKKVPQRGTIHSKEWLWPETLTISAGRFKRTLWVRRDDELSEDWMDFFETFQEWDFSVESRAERVRPKRKVAVRMHLIEMGLYFY